MLRLAAASGLKPAEFYDLSEREFEIWLEGRAELQDKVMQICAWVQTNLLNIQIPKGKPRITVDKLLPRRARKPVQSAEELDLAVELLTASSGQAQRLRAKQARRKEEAAEARRFWASPEGRKMARRMRELFPDEGGPS